MPWANVFDNVWLPLRLGGQSRRERAGEGRGGAGEGRPLRLRQGLPARTVRRHEDARLDRPRARHPPGAAADGRAVRRARRDHPHQTQRRSRRAQVRTRTRPSSSSPIRSSRASISPTASSSWRRGPAEWSPRSTCRRRCRATRNSASDAEYAELCRETSRALHRAMERRRRTRSAGIAHEPRAGDPSCAAERWRSSWRSSSGRRSSASTTSRPSSCRRRA